MNSINRIPIFFVLLLVIAFSGCAGPVRNMRPVSEESAVSAPMDGNSLMVFMRPSGIAFSVQAHIFEIKDDTPSLIGIVAAKKKVSYEVSPGEYLFMVAGVRGDFMKAELLPNKTYYSLIIPNLTGIWKAQFSLQPVPFAQLESTLFNTWLSECEWVEKTPQSEAWAQANKQMILEKYTASYPQWYKHDSSVKPALLPGDGI